ncbi:MAG: ring-cleaving dioxygenase [Bacteroidota bacterium]|nr:ring-cleaving dioxygenase [Candidatus Kapabacteria bacterium]MDW8219751.1 ring-cleaving dioxygenase [Bacteroidota bacterium]
MSAHITGLHHVTVLASDAAHNLAFYAGILGLRLVKQTVNFDAPDVYHLYYGNEHGVPGTILTFFPYKGLARGRRGKGQATVIALSISIHAIEYWLQRFQKFHVRHHAPYQRFGGELVLACEDSDGLALELVANTQDTRSGYASGYIPADYAIKGLYGVTLCEEAYEHTARLLVDTMNYQHTAEQDHRMRFSVSGTPGTFVDIVCSPDSLRGLNGSGTIHHLAFATANDHSQHQIREALLQRGFNVTPILDRQYFHSIYFREPGSILFEVATSDIGFTVDEPVEQLGTALKLPPWYESKRSALEQVLEPLEFRSEQFRD